MSDWKPLLEGLSSDPGRLLSRLVELTGSGDPFVVVLHLHSGRDVQGQLIARTDPDGSGDAWVLRGPAHERFPDDLSLVPASRVEAVTVQNVSRLVETIDRNQPPPSSLDLQRMARALGETATRAAGRPIEISLAFGDTRLAGDGATATRLLLERLRAVLEEITGTPIGKDALGAVTKLELTPGEAVAASARGGTVTITVPVGSPTWNRAAVPGPRDLKDRLEAVL